LASSIGDILIASTPEIGGIATAPLPASTVAGVLAAAIRARSVLVDSLFKWHDENELSGVARDLEAWFGFLPGHPRRHQFARAPRRFGAEMTRLCLENRLANRQEEMKRRRRSSTSREHSRP
jgi:hypothetical protein